MEYWIDMEDTDNFHRTSQHMAAVRLLAQPGFLEILQGNMSKRGESAEYCTVFHLS